MRRLPLILLTIVALLLTALPALAQEDPLANSVLLPGMVGFVLAGLAVLLFLLLLF